MNESQLTIAAVSGIALMLALTVVFKRRRRAFSHHDRELRSRLRDADPQMRARAAEALGESGSAEARHALVQTLIVEQDPHARAALVRALGAIGTILMDQAESFLSAYKDPNALSMGGDPGHYLDVVRRTLVPAIARSLKSSNVYEQEAALLALMWIGTRDAVEAIANSRSVAQAPAAFSSSPDAIQVSAYFPAEISRSASFRIYVYVYEQGHLSSVLRDARTSSAMSLADHVLLSSTPQSLKLVPGSPITVVSESRAGRCEPSSITRIWNKVPYLARGWIDFAFDFENDQDSTTSIIECHFSIQIHCIEIARLSVQVQLTGDSPTPSASSVGPRFCNESAAPYQRIFVSYSRKDLEVIEVYRAAQLALGNELFIDTYSLPPGGDWRQEIARAIGVSDIFQLFWSEHSARSQHVREEWSHALSCKQPQSQGEGFIRPVYWIRPMPAPPPAELEHLNFRYVDLGSHVKSTSIK
jgi:hypothetical protein